jgi:hypothetical protein
MPPWSRLGGSCTRGGLASARPVEDEDADADSTGVHVLQDVADLFQMVMDVDLFAGIPAFFLLVCRDLVAAICKK